MDHAAAEPARRGLTVRMTRVSFQPKTNPMMNPVTKVQKNCTNTHILSPSPSLIVLISLKEVQADGMSLAINIYVVFAWQPNRLMESTWDKFSQIT